MIQHGEVDFSANLGADGFKTVELGQGLHYSAPVMSVKWHWHSRLPVELSLTWNLLYLFVKLDFLLPLVFFASLTLSMMPPCGASVKLSSSDMVPTVKEF